MTLCIVCASQCHGYDSVHSVHQPMSWVRCVVCTIIAESMHKNHFHCLDIIKIMHTSNCLACTA